MIRHLASGFDVAPLLEQIEQRPEIWNTHRQRTEMYGTPHNGVSDIWVRYRPWEEYTGDWQAFHEEHVSVWYPVIHQIPSAWSLTRKVMRMTGKKQLGGVLITMIPPGGRVEPHIDGGWHAGHYEKFGLQLMGNKDQAFCFEGCELRPENGDLYTFRNDVLHWVENPSSTPRMTMIVCAR